MAGAFQTGTYRNVFAEAGYSEEIIKKRLEEIFQTMFYGTDGRESIIRWGMTWDI